MCVCVFVVCVFGNQRSTCQPCFLRWGLYLAHLLNNEPLGILLSPPASHWDDNHVINKHIFRFLTCVLRFNSGCHAYGGK